MRVPEDMASESRTPSRTRPADDSPICAGGPAAFVVSISPREFGSSSAVACHECTFDTGAFHDGLFQDYDIERPPALAHAVPRRKAEYLAGRLAAIRALQSLGIERARVGVGAHRCPLWPDGIVGSITHHETRAVSAVAWRARHAGIGIDLEGWMTPTTAESVRALILSRTEEDLLHRLPMRFALGLTLVFSAKESLFKALYPRVKRYFDFSSARVCAADISSGAVDLELTTSFTPEIQKGSTFRARFIPSDGAVFTSVVLPPSRVASAEPHEEEHGP